MDNTKMNRVDRSNAIVELGRTKVALKKALKALVPGSTYNPALTELYVNEALGRVAMAESELNAMRL